MSNAVSDQQKALERALHPEFRKYVTALEDIIDMAQTLTPSPEDLRAFIDEDEEWKEAWSWALSVLENNRVSCLGGNAYGVPFLHPDVARNLMIQGIAMGEEHGWKPNDEEEEPYQIPEIVVSHYNQRFHDLLAAQAKYLDIWHLILYQTIPEKTTSIQFTKYDAEETDHGNWHHDKCSDFTAVVSLNPGDFVGGGTDLRVTPVEFLTVPPLPAGFALLLNGKQLQHRGRKVEQGTRYLLTFWMESGSELA